VAFVCLESPSLGGSSTIEGHDHHNAIPHLLGGKRKLLVHNRIELLSCSPAYKGTDTSSDVSECIMEILNLLANDQAAGSTKCLANVAEGSNDCNDHVQMAFPVAAILMAEHSKQSF